MAVVIGRAWKYGAAPTTAEVSGTSKTSRLRVAQGHISEAVLRFLPRRVGADSALAERRAFQMTFKLLRQLFKSGASLKKRQADRCAQRLSGAGGGGAVSR